MNNKHEMQNFEVSKKTKKSEFADKEQEAPNEGNNYNTNNSFEPPNNVIHNDSKTILSDDNNKVINDNHNHNSNYVYTSKNHKYNNNNYNNVNNYNFNKLKQKTIETVLENEGEENCSYNQISAGRGVEKDPIVSFVFYKEENSDDDHAKANKDYEYINKDENKDNNNDEDEKSLSLNLNNSNKLNNIDLNYNNNTNCKNNNVLNKNNNENFNINEMIDNLTQSEIFGNVNVKKDKSSLSNDLMHNNANDNYKQTNFKNKNNNNVNIAEKSEIPQTVKYDVLFSEIVQACPIIQLSADTSKVFLKIKILFSI